MAISKLVPALVLAVTLGGAALAQPGARPMLAKAKDLDAKVAKTKDGLASAQLPTGSPDHMVVLVRRTADGEVELHAKMADEIIVRSGKARIKIGGTAAGQRQTAPGEFRGGAITGGEVFDLNPGDAIWVPVGQPHQVLVPKGGQITYIAAKFPG